jgi:hypothetical protein
MQESILSNVLRYPNCTGGLNSYPMMGARDFDAKQASIEDIEKMRAENQAREEESRRRAIACAVVQIAEQLVIRHNLTVCDAFERAKELAIESTSFVENFQLSKSLN